MTPTTSHPFQFRGTGRDYAKLWFRNLALTVLTLGVYSAWAKVNRLRYFYQATSVARANFDYHGKPEAILKGRILLVLVIGGGHFVKSFGAWPTHLVTLFFAFLFPWAYAQALRFRSHSTSYRGLRFGNTVTDREAYSALLLPSVITGVAADIVGYISGTILPGVPAFLVTICVIVLGVAYLQFWTRNILWGKLRFGSSDFELKLPLRDILLTWIVAGLGVYVGMQILIFSPITKIGFKPWVVLVGVTLLLAKSYIEAETRTRIAASLTLNGIRFRSGMRTGTLFFLQARNILFTAVTAGIYWPWASTALWKYRVESLELFTDRSFEEFTAGDQRQGSAIGESLAETFDWDIGF